MAKQEKAKKPGTSVAPKAGMDLTVTTGDTLPDYIQRTDVRGTENLGMADLIIPRLEIVQGLSPAVKRGDPGYIEGAQAGMLNNSVTRQLYGDSVMAIPVHYAMQYLVWRDRKLVEAHNVKNPRQKLPTEGGFFGAYQTVEEAKKRADEEGGEDQCIVVTDTPTHLCLLLNRDSGSIDEIMVPMPRTKAKPSRAWNTMIKLAGGPRFGRVFTLKTVLTKNAKGDYYNFAIEVLGFPSKPMYERAEKLYQQITSGERKHTMDTRDYNAATEPNTDM